MKSECPMKRATYLWCGMAVLRTPGAAGVLDLYLINSSVKGLRVDGELPFDAGYALKGN